MNKNLTEVELDYMKILWKKRKLSVQQMQDSLPSRKRTRYTTVLTTLRRMEEKGHIAHEERDRTYYYYPVVTEVQVKSNTIKSILRNIFNGNPVELIQNLAKEERLSDKEIKEIKGIIKNWEVGK